MTGFETVPYETFGIHRPALSYFSIFDEYRERAPAFRLDIAPGNEGWMLTRLAAIREAFQHPETFSSTAVIPSAPDPQYKLISQIRAPPGAVELQCVCYVNSPKIPRFRLSGRP